MSLEARLEGLLRDVGLDPAQSALVEIERARPLLPARFPVGEAASVALAACGVAVARVWALRTGRLQRVRVSERRAEASLRSNYYQRLDGRPVIRQERDHLTITRLYRARDGRWIHLHGGFPHLADGTLRVLDCPLDEEAIARAVCRWDAVALEDALAADGLCAAVARTADEWNEHPQGAAVASRPLVEIVRISDADPRPLSRAERPLDGVRVLDVTRVLAGPVAGRTLAEHGARVLAITSPHLPFADSHVLDTTHGKRAAFLDLRDPADEARLRALVRDADVFIQAYRPGSLERRGLGPDALARLRPGLVYVSVSCYGDTGPWRERRGWEQLAQTVSGIAVAQGTAERPALMPALACDYTTGYLAALGAMAALVRRAREGGSYHVKVSLCRTARWLVEMGPTVDPTSAVGLDADAVAALRIDRTTPFGRLSYLPPVVELSETPACWTLPPTPLGAHPPTWGE